MSNIVRTVLRHREVRARRSSVDSNVVPTVDSSNSLATSLDEVLEVGVFSQVKFVSGVHRAKRRHKVLDQVSSGVASSFNGCVSREDESLSSRFS